MLSEREIRARCLKARMSLLSGWLPPDERRRNDARSALYGWVMMQEESGMNRRAIIRFVLEESAWKSARFARLPRRVHQAVRLLGYKPDFIGIRQMERTLEVLDQAHDADTAFLLMYDQAVVDAAFEHGQKEAVNG